MIIIVLVSGGQQFDHHYERFPERDAILLAAPLKKKMPAVVEIMPPLEDVDVVRLEKNHRHSWSKDERRARREQQRADRRGRW